MGNKTGILRQYEGGFTLVEIAIVLTIIGLLIGGVLKGSEMIQQAKVVATVQQIKSYSAALNTFRDIYNAVPGDFPGAGTRIPGCTAVCSPFAGANAAGNGIVGDPVWEDTWNPQGIATLGNVAATSASQETYLFWTHLLMANLITGVTTQSIERATPYEWGVTHPTAKIGGGWVVGNANTSPGQAPGNSGRNCGNGNNNGNNGNCRNGAVQPIGVGSIIVLLNAPTSVVGSTSGVQPISPILAWRLDSKMDDGNPDSGYIQSYGVSASCFTDGGAGSGYQRTVTKRDCGLIATLWQ